jgi:hypothetical protein
MISILFEQKIFLVSNQNGCVKLSKILSKKLACLTTAQKSFITTIQAAYGKNTYGQVYSDGVYDSKSMYGQGPML